MDTRCNSKTSNLGLVIFLARYPTNCASGIKTLLLYFTSKRNQQNEDNEISSEEIRQIDVVKPKLRRPRNNTVLRATSSQANIGRLLRK